MFSKKYSQQSFSLIRTDAPLEKEVTVGIPLDSILNPSNGHGSADVRILPPFSRSFVVVRQGRIFLVTRFVHTQEARCGTPTIGLGCVVAHGRPDADGKKNDGEDR